MMVEQDDALARQLSDSMNDLAVNTEPLSGADVLRRGRRYRTRRRVGAALGTAAAVLVVVVGVSLARSPGSREDPVPPAAASRPATIASSAVPRFTFTPDQPGDGGFTESSVTDRSLPPEFADHPYLLNRKKGDTKPPAPDNSATQNSQLSVDGIKVRIARYQMGAGDQRKIEWIAGGTHFIVIADRDEGDDGKVHGLSDHDVPLLVRAVDQHY